MSDTELRDNKKTSRKGRKPKSDKAMTPAERKRQQRQRQREAKCELPSWLRLRRDLWELIQDHFMFEDADELSAALNALGAAITIANCYRSTKEPSQIWCAGLVAYHDPPEQLEGRLQLFSELKAYRFDSLHYPAREGTKLVDILRDIMECHENEVPDQ